MLTYLIEITTQGTIFIFHSMSSTYQYFQHWQLYPYHTFVTYPAWHTQLHTDTYNITLYMTLTTYSTKSTDTSTVSLYYISYNSNTTTYRHQHYPSIYSIYHLSTSPTPTVQTPTLYLYSMPTLAATPTQLHTDKDIFVLFTSLTIWQAPQNQQHRHLHHISSVGLCWQQHLHTNNDIILLYATLTLYQHTYTSTTYASTLLPLYCLPDQHNYIPTPTYIKHSPHTNITTPTFFILNIVT